MLVHVLGFAGTPGMVAIRCFGGTYPDEIVVAAAGAAGGATIDVVVAAMPAGAASSTVMIYVIGEIPAVVAITDGMVSSGGRCAATAWIPDVCRCSVQFCETNQHCKPDDRSVGRQLYRPRHGLWLVPISCNFCRWSNA